MSSSRSLIDTWEMLHSGGPHRGTQVSLFFFNSVLAPASLGVNEGEWFCFRPIQWMRCDRGTGAPRSNGTSTCDSLYGSPCSRVGELLRLGMVFNHVQSDRPMAGSKDDHGSSGLLTWWVAPCGASSRNAMSFERDAPRMQVEGYKEEKT